LGQTWRRLDGAARSIGWFKAALGLAGVLYLLGVLRITLHAQDDFGQLHVFGALTMAFLPIGAVLALRYPLIFPFLVYVALIPYDAMLRVSSSSTIVRVIGFATGGALALHMLLVRRAMVPPRVFRLWALFVAYAAVSMLWAPDFPNAVNTMSTILQLFLLMLLLAMYPASRREFDVAMTGIVLVGAGAAVYALHEYFSGSVTVEEGRLIIQSAAGIELDPNYLASAFIIPLTIGLCGFAACRNLLLKLACATAILLMFSTILTTGSRSGVVAALIVFAYFALRSRYRIHALLAATGAIAASFAFPSVWARFANDSGDTASGRTYIWQTGMYNFRDHWLFGAGVGSYPYEYDHNVAFTYQRMFAGWSRPGHSIVFVGLNDFGVIGIILVAVCWYASFHQLHRIPPTHSLYTMRLGCEAMILGLFATALFVDPYYIKYIWLAHSLPFMVLNLYEPRFLRVGRSAPAGSFGRVGGRGSPRTPRAARGI